MNEYAGAIAGWRPNLKSFRQLMVFSSTWTPGLNSFLKHYMTDPVIVISAPLEAAVYAHIKWVGKALYDRPSDCHHCPTGSCCVCTHQMGR